MLHKFFVANIDELSNLSRLLVSALQPSDCILLSGELGSGKSEFVRQCAKHLGVTEEITSPTFCFENTYSTNKNFSLNHFDLYKLTDESELEEIGFYEDGYEPKHAVAFIEWSNLFPDEMPDCALSLEFKGSGNSPREIYANGSSKRALALISAMGRKG